MDTLANTSASMHIQQEPWPVISKVVHKRAGVLIPAATLLDSCALMKSVCTLSWSNSLPFPDNFHWPRVDNGCVLPMLEPISSSCMHQYQQPLRHSTDPQQQQHNYDATNWWNNAGVRDNPEPWYAPAFPYPSTSPFQPLCPTSLSPSQPPSKKVRRARVSCTCPNCVNGLNNIKYQDETSKKKQHICHYPGCNKVYERVPRLHDHLRRQHTGERPYVCNWPFCTKKFTRSDELLRHRRTHTGDKRYKCKLYSKQFTRSDHLRQHMETQTHA